MKNPIRLFLLLALPLSVACGSESFDTARDAAISIGEAICERGAECGEIDDVDGCVDLFVGEACNAVDCNAEPNGSNDAINDCIDAIGGIDCEDGELPAECNSVI